MKTNRKAFTLVELIVVMTIIWILAALWIIWFAWYVRDGRDTSRITDVTQIKKSIDLVTAKWFAPRNLTQLKELEEFPTDPQNGFGYQYNTNKPQTAVNSRKAAWKWFAVCTNVPLEKYTDSDGSLLSDYLEDIDYGERDKFIVWKLQNRVSGNEVVDVEINKTLWYFCAGNTTSFDDLLMWGWSNSYATQNCSAELLSVNAEEGVKGSTCRIVFNAIASNQALWESPAAGTPFEMPE